MSELSQHIVSASVLRAYEEAMFVAAGCSPADARQAAEVMWEADLRGISSHGLIRMPDMIKRINEGMIDPKARPRIVQEREGSALVDAGGALGPIGGTFAIDLAMRKAVIAGTCSVGLLNANHLIFVGYYGERIARAGMACILTTVTPPLAHPYGGTERIIGTNPLVIALPSDEEEPLLLDFATTEIAFGNVMKARAKGESLPEGVALGPDGAPTTDPAEAAQGALTPFGGYKGYGLNLMLGLLAGPMVGGLVGKAVAGVFHQGRKANKGDLFIVIDPAAFGDPSVFRRAVSAHIKEIKDSPLASGADEIRMPGERSFRERAIRLREGVAIEENVWRASASLAEELGVAVPD
ncbi:MAG: Ldh family oxidoreductase [Nitrospinaceae bacterium]|nr:Ldh family oxidoreductase [Nitrospinaceae bacterium]